MANVLIFLCNTYHVEAVKTFVLDWDNYEEANEVCDREIAEAVSGH